MNLEARVESKRAEQNKRKGGVIYDYDFSLWFSSFWRLPLSTRFPLYFLCE